MSTQLLDDFDKQVNWLYTLITDPTGSRYFQDKSPETLLEEFQEQLARTADFLEFAGEPQARFSSVHVAGTSGKGSVVTMIAALLAGCGLRTGYHVSPYLQVCNEKLVVNGQMIAPSEFIELVGRFREIHAAWGEAGRPFTSLRYVEAWAALTYLWFAQRGVDWAVVETGLGGRFDPTNVLPSSLAVITNIDYDHVEVLGPTLADIAYHKAGIIKEKGLAITATTDKSALRVIREEAARKNARLYCLEEDFSFSVKAMGEDGTRLSVQAPFRRYDDVQVGMKGVFQPVNAALAVAAVDVLAQKCAVPFTTESAQAALKALQFPGRMEVIQEKPLVILDGAHNPHKMRSLVDSLRAAYPGKKVTAIIGVLAMKDARSMLKVLLAGISQVVVTKPTVFGKPSAQPAALAGVVQEIAPGIKIHVVDNVQESIELALGELGPDELLLITGSLYLLGEARNYWVSREQLLNSLEKLPFPNEYDTIRVNLRRGKSQ